MNLSQGLDAAIHIAYTEFGTAVAAWPTFSLNCIEDFCSWCQAHADAVALVKGPEQATWAVVTSV